MALIICKKCREKASSEDTRCPHCGTTIISKNQDVTIKFPICRGQVFSDKCYIYDKQTNEKLVCGKQGEEVSFKVSEARVIYASIKGVKGSPEVLVSPGDKYNLKCSALGKIYFSKVDKLSRVEFDEGFYADIGFMYNL